MGFTGINGSIRAETEITPVENSGIITTIPAMINSKVNAVAMGQRLRLPDVDADSSSVSPNIFLTSNREIGHRERGGGIDFAENKKAAGEGGLCVSQEQLRFLWCRGRCSRMCGRRCGLRGSCSTGWLGSGSRYRALSVISIHEFFGNNISLCCPEHG